MIAKLRNLTPANKKYYHDEHRFIITTAGRRSRKTLIGKQKTLIRACRKKGRYFAAAPTMGQAITIFWDDLMRTTDQIRKSYSKTNHSVELLNGSIIRVVGLDKPERIEGRAWHGGHITETPNIKPNAWASNIRPALSDTLGWAILDGVPETRNWFYEMVLSATSGAIPVTMPMTGAYAENGEWSYHNWFSADVLTPKEIESAQAELDERTYRREYEGSFESTAGLAYYGFSHENVDDGLEYEPGAIVHIGMDFNVNPMTAVLAHISQDGIVHQFGEAYLTNSNTLEMGQHIADLYGVDRCVIYPDSTGDSRTSNATTTDIRILRDMGFTVYAKTVNPRVRDRINSVNSRMRPMTGEAKYYVNSKTCPKTIRDLTMVESTDDGRVDKRQERKGLVHITDALGYMIHYLYPIVKSELTKIDRR